MCLRYQRCGGSRGYSHTLLLRSKRRTSWRCEELFILGSVVNWSNGLWTSTKPLPNSYPDPCNVERWHGKGKRQQQRFHTRRQPLQRCVGNQGLEKWERERRLAGTVQVERMSALILAPRSTRTCEMVKHGDAHVTSARYNTLQHV